jgi:PPOX class probable F420-dependent enzyme
VELAERDARDRFASVAVAHLATADEHGQPHVVVTTFAVEGDRIVMAVDHKPKRTQNLKRLRNILHNPKVAVLVDHYDNDWTRLWWVRADGTARILEDHADRQAPVHMLQDKYGQYQASPPDGPVIEITVSRWIGWSGAQ